jgi:5-methylcytosine-specific restriction enzyme A
MRIDRTKYDEVYRCGRQVHARKMRITDAKRRLKEIGVNPNSSVAYVYGLGHLLDGHRYTRTMPAHLVEDYLLWIERDYDRRFLKNALSALQQHIEYYRSLKKTPMRGHVKILERYASLLNEEIEDFVSPEEIAEPEEIVEGGARTIFVNIYERNSKARRECIEHFGCICSVCEFDFEKRFGAIGRGFIHVHHLRDLASIGKSYIINPKEDLRPVCPNCHVMLHKSRPAYRIEELKELIAAQ